MNNEAISMMEWLRQKLKDQDHKDYTWFNMRFNRHHSHHIGVKSELIGVLPPGASGVKTNWKLNAVIGDKPAAEVIEITKYKKAS